MPEIIMQAMKYVKYNLGDIVAIIKNIAENEPQPIVCRLIFQYRFIQIVILHNIILLQINRWKKNKSWISMSICSAMNRNIPIIIKGMNLSDCFSIVNDSNTFIFFSISKKVNGITNVVTKTIKKHSPTLMMSLLHIPDIINIKNIHVGSNIGCDIMDMN